MSDTRLIHYGESSNEGEESRPSSRKQLLSAFLSAMVPGAGLWVIGAKAKAIVIFALFLVDLSFFWPMRLTQNYVTWIVCCAILPVVYMVSAGYTLLASNRLAATRPSPIWLMAVLPFALIVGCIAINPATLAAGMHPFQMKSGSMEPTMFIDDGVMCDMRFYQHREPLGKDILVFRHGDIILMKRLIATGGETVSSEDGRIKVNGVFLDEPYATHAGGAPDEMKTFEPIKIPEGHLFVLGDNRDQSLDSRSAEFGFVARRDVLGRAGFIYKSRHDQTGRAPQ